MLTLRASLVRALPLAARGAAAAQQQRPAAAAAGLVCRASSSSSGADGGGGGGGGELLLRAKLELITAQPCPRWHADTVGIRCLCTYEGAVTLYVPNK